MFSADDRAGKLCETREKSVFLELRAIKGCIRPRQSERNAVDGMQRCAAEAATGSETYHEGYNGASTGKEGGWKR